MSLFPGLKSLQNLDWVCLRAQQHAEDVKAVSIQTDTQTCSQILERLLTWSSFGCYNRRCTGCGCKGGIMAHARALGVVSAICHLPTCVNNHMCHSQVNEWTSWRQKVCTQICLCMHLQDPSKTPQKQTENKTVDTFWTFLSLFWQFASYCLCFIRSLISSWVLLDHSRSYRSWPFFHLKKYSFDFF